MEIVKKFWTVASTLYAFTDKYPDVFIYVTGSTKSRTRLYRMGISKFLKDIREDFEVLGELENDWEEFNFNTEYNGFLVRRK